MKVGFTRPAAQSCVGIQSMISEDLKEPSSRTVSHRIPAQR
jgi:hypothetical protein